MTSLRVALLVEGSLSPSPPRGARPLERIWNEHIADALGVARFEPIIPISKKHLVAMDTTKPKMSGAAERLDQLIVRVRARQEFDAAVVAWDLVPAWNSEGTYCRWDETVRLYRMLATSTVLPEPWVAEARRRRQELSSRATPGARPGTPQLRRHMILALCMEPMFEGLLVQDQRAVRRILGLMGQTSPRGWPASGWGSPALRHPDSELLVPAIAALKRLRPRVDVTKVVPGDFRTNKDGWGEYFLRHLLDDDGARPQVLDHPICRRLHEWIA